MLLLSVYALSYLWLIFSWVELALRLPTWYCWSLILKASHLCCALELLEDKEPTVHLGVNAYTLPAWVHFPDTERVEWLNKMVKHTQPLYLLVYRDLSRNHRTSCAGSKYPPRHLQLHKSECGSAAA